MTNSVQTVFGSSEVVACELDAGIALLDASRNIYFTLNATGALVWRTITSRPSSIDEICDAVARHFEVTRDACRSDVISMVEKLVEMKLARTNVATGK